MSILSNNFEKGQFVSVYDQTESDGNFHVCRYLCEDDDFVLFQAISTRGYNDGFYLIPIDYIYRIGIDYDYTKRMERLFVLQGQEALDEISVVDDSLLIGLLYHSKKNGLVLSVFLDDEESVTGRVHSVDAENGCFCIAKLTDNGTKNGMSFINTERIEKIICDSGAERIIEMLMGEK